MLVSILARICLCQSFFNSNNNIFQKLVPEFQKKALFFFSYLVNEGYLQWNTVRLDYSTSLLKIRYNWKIKNNFKNYCDVIAIGELHCTFFYFFNNLLLYLVSGQILSQSQFYYRMIGLGVMTNFINMKFK